MASKRKLGRGLGALIKDERTPVKKAETSSGNGVLKVEVDKIRKGRMQPRRHFDKEALAELSASIKEQGLLQPLLVRPAKNGGYELIAGERRLRAAGEAGLLKVPVIVMDVKDSRAMELALIENLQREDLNIIEEAEGYQVLANKFNLTQEQISVRVGKARASVANAIRLLDLPDDVKILVSSGDLSAGHAKLLTGMGIKKEQSLYAKMVVKDQLSVRQLEKLVQKVKQAPRKARAARNDIPKDHLSYISDKLHSHFGTSVRISPCKTFANGKKGKGSIEVDYFSNEDLDRILEVLGISTD